MGTWGTSVFASDTACDVRELYRALLDSGVDDDRSTLEVLEAYGTDDPEVWLALAASQSRLGRLDERVRARTVQIIDTEEDLADWDDSAAGLRRGRVRALLRLRQTITGPQPERRTIKVKWSHHTDLQVGEVLRHVSKDASSLWIVVDVKPYPTGTHPWVRRLTDHDSVPASAKHVWDLVCAGAVIPQPAWHEIWAVRMKRREPDWLQAGFSKLPGTAPFDTTLLPRSSYIGIGWHEIDSAVVDGRNPFDGLYMGGTSDDLADYLAGWDAHIEAMEAQIKSDPRREAHDT